MPNIPPLNNKDDQNNDLTLRPTEWDEYIGQEKIKDNLKTILSAAKKRGESADHLLFSGPAGLGKTTLAYLVARELGGLIKTTAGPAIEKAGDLFPGCPAERGRDGQVFGSRGRNHEIKGIPAAHPVHGSGEVVEIPKRHPVACIPVQVLIAEMIHRTDFVTGKSGRLRHMARGKSGNKDPAFHNSSVCFPAREGTIRIFAPGNSRENSTPS